MVAVVLGAEIDPNNATVGYLTDLSYQTQFDCNDESFPGAYTSAQGSGIPTCDEYLVLLCNSTTCLYYQYQLPDCQGEVVSVTPGPTLNTCEGASKSVFLPGDMGYEVFGEALISLSYSTASSIEDCPNSLANLFTVTPDGVCVEESIVTCNGMDWTVSLYDSVNCSGTPAYVDPYGGFSCTSDGDVADSEYCMVSALNASVAPSPAPTGVNDQTFSPSAALTWVPTAVAPSPAPTGVNDQTFSPSAALTWVPTSVNNASSTSASSLSPGAIAGISVSALLVLIGVCVLVFYSFCKSPVRTDSVTNDSISINPLNTKLLEA